MRTVIFDLDGTLADTSGDLIAAANCYFRAKGHGCVLDPVADAYTAHQGGRAMLRLGLSRLGAWTEAQVDAGYPALLAAYEGDICRQTYLYPGAMEAVQALKDAGFRTGICTNKPVRLAEILLQKLGVLDQFGALVGSGTLPVAKPDPAPYRLTVERAGGDVARSILIGDTETDRKTGLAAGVPVVLVTFGPEGERVARFAPEAMIGHFDELPGLAETLLPRAH